MALTQQIRASWQKPSEAVIALWRERLIQWRREPVTIRLERPTRLDRARALGYKSKPGVFIVRQRVVRGAHHRSIIGRGARMSKNSRRTLALSKNYQLIAEEHANKIFHNCEVINSYFVLKDGKYSWYEVILADPCDPNVRADTFLGMVTKRNDRVGRGLTSAGRRMRGLYWKGKGAEKSR